MNQSTSTNLDPIEQRRFVNFPELHGFDSEEIIILSYWIILNEPLNRSDILTFLAICEVEVREQTLNEFFQRGLTSNIINRYNQDDNENWFYSVEDRLKQLIKKELTKIEIEARHKYANQFYLDFFSQFLVLPDSDPIQSDLLIKYISAPGGFIYRGAHAPGDKVFHDVIINKALYWQEHLFALGMMKEGADIINSICFSLARTGHGNIAKELLSKYILELNGMSKAVALTNLATLYRQENEHKIALSLYRKTYPVYLKTREFHQVASVISEVSTAHRYLGHLIRALYFQHVSKLIRRIIHDTKGIAICNNQLSILYRNIGFYWVSLRLSKKAEVYWRLSNDEVNLAKTMLTQGNLFYYQKKSTKALKCYQESLKISNHLGDMGCAAGSNSGIARVHMLSKEFGQAQKYLDEAIALRKRSGDSNIGVEYENMGTLCEKQGNFELALQWYTKALAMFDKYMPSYSGNVKLKIHKIKRKL